MIHVQRLAPPAGFTAAQPVLEAHIATRYRLLSRSRIADSELLGDPLLDVVFDALIDQFASRCAYCETPVDRISAVIDPFRPPVLVDDSGASGRDPEIYHSFITRWTNLYLACVTCAQLRYGRFPLLSQPMKRDTLLVDPERELRALIDPCLDYPERHFMVDELGALDPITKRGKVTVEVFGLNRDELTKNRRRTYFVVQRNLQQTLANITVGLTGDDADRTKVAAALAQRFHSPKIAFMFAARNAIRDTLAEDGQLLAMLVEHPTTATVITELMNYGPKGFAATKVTPAQGLSRIRKKPVEYGSFNARYYDRARRIESIEIHNFKSIKSVRIQVPPPTNDRESCLAVIGENGAGKSALLQAVTLTLIGTERCTALGLTPDQVLRHGTNKGMVSVRLTGFSEPLRMSFTRGARTFIHVPTEPQVLIQAYGPVRLLPTQTNTRIDQSDDIRVRNLFNPLAPLAGSATWLQQARSLTATQRAQVGDILTQVLLLDVKSTLHVTEDDLVLATVTGDLRFRELSAGYQSMIALCLDIIAGIGERWPRYADAEGLVIIDEIEAHLHPRWTQQIVTRLRACFPRMVFLITTHDPLCLHGLRREEIVRLMMDTSDRSDAPQTVTDTDLPDLAALRADQILTSSYFGLATTRSEMVVARTGRYHALLHRHDRTPDEEAEFLILEEQIAAQPLGETPLDQLLREATAMAISDPAPDAKDDALSPVFARAVRLHLQRLLQRFDVR